MSYRVKSAILRVVRITGCVQAGIFRDAFDSAGRVTGKLQLRNVDDRTQCGQDLWIQVRHQLCLKVVNRSVHECDEERVRRPLEARDREEQ